jgi:acyl-CoA synthetase (NDP forming)
METNAKIIEKALSEGRSVLSEHESKEFLRTYGIPVTREAEVHDQKELGDALDRIGYPLVIKGSSPHVAHKSEQGLVKVDIRNVQEAEAAFQEIMSRMGDGEKAVLVQEMVKGSRELMVGMTRDPQFGPCVMFGLGGVFTEVLKDVAFRVAPLE